MIARRAAAFDDKSDLEFRRLAVHHIFKKREHRARQEKAKTAVIVKRFFNRAARFHKIYHRAAARIWSEEFAFDKNVVAANKVVVRRKFRRNANRRALSLCPDFLCQIVFCHSASRMKFRLRVFDKFLEKAPRERRKSRKRILANTHERRSRARSRGNAKISAGTPKSRAGTAARERRNFY